MYVGEEASDDDGTWMIIQACSTAITQFYDQFAYAGLNVLILYIISWTLILLIRRFLTGRW